MRIAFALLEVHDAESDLAQALVEVGDRHRPDHDVFHLTRMMSGWASERLHHLATHFAAYDADHDPGDRVREYGIAAVASAMGAGLTDHAPEGPLVLLRDIRDLHLLAARASLAWTILGQGAQAVLDRDLQTTVARCHPETIRTMKWTAQKAKEASPQILAS